MNLRRDFDLGATPPTEREEVPFEGQIDPVLEASWESFPASDPPAWAVGVQVWSRSPHQPTRWHGKEPGHAGHDET